MLRALRNTLLIVVAAGALAAPVWGEIALRGVSWFGVERVEISGTRYLAPHEVLTSSGIHTGQNLWDDPAGWEAALREHPVIADARITRRLPRTLRVRIEEKRPVAFLEAGTLQPVSSSGELLPIDPTRAPVDLPIIQAPKTPTDSTTLRMLAETDRLSRLDPALFAEVSEIRSRDAAGTLVLRHRIAEIILPHGVEAMQLTQLRSVLLDLERRLEGSGSTPSKDLPRVDLRYGDQIVVRLSSTA
jgi:cell division protein FtsQ